MSVAFELEVRLDIANSKVIQLFKVSRVETFLCGKKGLHRLTVCRMYINLYLGLVER